MCNDVIMWRSTKRDSKRKETSEVRLYLSECREWLRGSWLLHSKVVVCKYWLNLLNPRHSSVCFDARCVRLLRSSVCWFWFWQPPHINVCRSTHRIPLFLVLYSFYLLFFCFELLTIGFLQGLTLMSFRISFNLRTVLNSSFRFRSRHTHSMKEVRGGWVGAWR